MDFPAKPPRPTPPFEVVCDESNNSPEDVEKGILRATIKIPPPGDIDEFLSGKKAVFAPACRIGKDDAQYRARLMRAPCTTNSIALECEHVIREAKPLGISVPQVCGELARRWLRNERPKSFWTRLRWIASVVRGIF